MWDDFLERNYQTNGFLNPYVAKLHCSRGAHLACSHTICLASLPLPLLITRIIPPHFLCLIVSNGI